MKTNPAVLSCAGSDCHSDISTHHRNEGRFQAEWTNFGRPDHAKRIQPELTWCSSAEYDRCVAFTYTGETVESRGTNATNAKFSVKEAHCGNGPDVGSEQYKYNCAAYKKLEGTERDGISYEGTTREVKYVTKYLSVECTETTVDGPCDGNEGRELCDKGATKADLKTAEAADGSFAIDAVATFNAAGQVVPSAVAFVFAAAVSMMM